MFYYVWPFLVYWLVLFVLCYVVTDYAQKYLYDETTPMVGVKVLIGSAILAALLVYTRTSYDTMLTSEIGLTVIQAIVWFAVFTLVLQFQPWHGFAIGVVTMALVAGLATMGVDSITRSNRVAAVPENRPISKPVRRSSSLNAPDLPKPDATRTFAEPKAAETEAP